MHPANTDEFLGVGKGLRVRVRDSGIKVEVEERGEGVTRLCKGFRVKE
jgi:hypothetical protein